VIARAGGVTAQAYLYGLEFSREETRRRQRENLNTAIARLESLAPCRRRDAATGRRRHRRGRRRPPSATRHTGQLSRLRSSNPTAASPWSSNPNRVARRTSGCSMEQRSVVVPAPRLRDVAGAVVNSNAYLWRPAHRG